MADKIDQLAELLSNSHRIVFFGGAGVSTASNIPDFRSSTGLFSQKLCRTFTPEQAVSHTFFLRYPEEFYDFYKKNLVYPEAKPNPCHTALVTLEKQQRLIAIVTQNIDGLHQKAGSQKVFELHGSVLRNYCTECHAAYDVEHILQSQGIPVCPECGGIIKPDVVLYEEGLNDAIVTGAIQAISQADTLIIGGTSLVVYPAAGLIDYFQGKNLILINKTPTPADHRANLVINDNIDIVLWEAVKRMTP